MISFRANPSRVLIFALLCACICFHGTQSASEDKKVPDKEKWKKKDVRDYTDADMERLFEQWEDADEDELEEDELPEWKREPPKVDMSKMDPSDPEGMLKMSKKGRTLMMFATISGNPTEEETEKISGLWHGSLFNAHIDTQKFVVASDRVLFMLKDGSKAWQVRDYLVQQPRCQEVSIESQNYPGAGKDSATGSKDSQKKQAKDKKDEL